MEPEEIEELMAHADMVVEAADEMENPKQFAFFVNGLIYGAVVAYSLRHGLKPKDAVNIAQQTVQYARASIDANKAERKRIRESN